MSFRVLNNTALSAQLQIAKKPHSLQKVDVHIWSLATDISSALKDDAQTKVIQPYPPSEHVNMENSLRLYFETQLRLPAQLEMPSINPSFCIHQLFNSFEDQIPQLFQMECFKNRTEREIHLIITERASSDKQKEWLYSLKSIQSKRKDGFADDTEAFIQFFQPFPYRLDFPHEIVHSRRDRVETTERVVQESNSV
ncbi:hypothetical protein WISP_83469 [Willisornis vidua]|uniref:Uncharacterized protein n=1 Tax=Willisornis vidua TaxID=1566151 RepID=A0ABQ9D8D0_9PASS|nr:hypothetical protein WISP_83469 [Willisornis vidua]